MTDHEQPLTVGTRDSLRIVLIVSMVVFDAMLVASGLAVIRTSRSLSAGAIVGIAVAVIVVGIGASWVMWRASRTRIEFSSNQVAVIGVFTSRYVAMSDVLRVDVVDGRTLRPRISDDSGGALYLPVVKTKVYADEVPVVQMAEILRKDAETNADSLRWVIDRAANPTANVDPTQRPGLHWRDDGA